MANFLKIDGNYGTKGRLEGLGEVGGRGWGTASVEYIKVLKIVKIFLFYFK